MSSQKNTYIDHSMKIYFQVWNDTHDQKKASKARLDDYDRRVTKRIKREFSEIFIDK